MPDEPLLIWLALAAATAAPLAWWGVRQPGAARPLALLLAFGIGYAAIHELSSATYFQPIGEDPELVAVFWPSSGFLMGVLLVTRFLYWPWVLLVGAAVLMHSDLRLHDLALGQTLVWTPVGLLEGVLGALPLRLIARGTPDLTRPRDWGLFIVWSVIVATAASAALGAMTYVMTFPDTQYLPVWLVWWMSDGLGVLAVAPLVVAWAGPTEMARVDQPLLHRVEAIALIVLLVLVGMLSVGPLRLATSSVLDFPYLVIPFLVWAALRFSPRVSMTATLLATLLAVFTAKGAVARLVGLDPDLFRGPFYRPDQPPGDTVRSLQAFLFVMLFSTMLLVALARQRYRKSQEAIALRDQLYDAQRMEAVAQLAAGVAHDINNLLAVLAIHRTQIAERLGQDPEFSSSLNAMDNATDQAVALSRSLLDLSRRPDASRMTTIDLAHALREAVRLYRGLIPAGTRLVLVELSGPAPLVRGDPARLQQVILNLLVNARDALPIGGGRIEIGLRRTGLAGNETELFIRDAGKGIDPKDLPHIFEPLYTTKPRGEGTGLGLSVVHSIVEEMGGAIEVQSVVGRGTEFAIRFPMVGAAAEPLPAGGVSLSAGMFGAAAREGARRRHNCAREVWVAVANRQVRGAILADLTLHGMHALPCEDPLARLEQIMGKAKNGAVLVAEIEEFGPADLAPIADRSPPVLLLGTAESLAPARELGLKTHEKPFRIAALSAAIDSM